MKDTGAPADLVVLQERAREASIDCLNGLLQNVNSEAYGRLSEARENAIADLLNWHPAVPAPPPVEADTMPMIEVGDVLFLHEFGHLYGNHTEVTSKEIADWFNRPENIVVAIYRDPIWRRPSPQEPTFFVSPEKEQG